MCGASYSISCLPFYVQVRIKWVLVEYISTAWVLRHFLACFIEGAGLICLPLCVGGARGFAMIVLTLPLSAHD